MSKICIFTKRFLKAMYMTIWLQSFKLSSKMRQLFIDDVEQNKRVNSPLSNDKVIENI
jgi:hypothetical protein